MPPKFTKGARKIRKGLRRVSDKLKRALAIYHKVTKPLWLKLHPRCQFILTPGASCGEKFGVTVHHKKGRGKYLNDMRFFMTACQEHHSYIENHKNWAREQAYILYK